MNKKIIASATVALAAVSGSAGFALNGNAQQDQTVITVPTTIASGTDAADIPVSIATPVTSYATTTENQINRRIANDQITIQRAQADIAKEQALLSTITQAVQNSGN